MKSKMREVFRKIDGKTIPVYEREARSKDKRTRYIELYERLTGTREWHRIVHTVRKGVTIDTGYKDSKQEAKALFNKKMSLVDMEQGELFAETDSA